MWSEKLKITEEQIRRQNRFNLLWHIYRWIDKLLDSDNFVDIGLAKLLLIIPNWCYWLKYESCLAWCWYKINCIGAYMKIRKPIDEFWEFTHWHTSNDIIQSIKNANRSPPI